MGNVMVKRVNAAYSKEEDIFRVMRYMCSEKDCGERLSYWNTRGGAKGLGKSRFQTGTVTGLFREGLRQANQPSYRFFSGDGAG